MKNYAICFCYLPILDFSGFSDQLHDSKNIFTLVVEALEKSRLYHPGSDTKIRFASRTDRGVGAFQQVVSINSSQSPILSEINSYLPDEIQALGMTEVPLNFHPRRDALLRTYSYFLATPRNFNLQIARNTLQQIKGTHNFRNFAKIDSKKVINTIRKIESVDIIPVGKDTYQIRISSKSFLWQQVRRIIGHLIQVTNGVCDLDHTKLLLESEDLKKPPAAPSQNLILEKIKYSDVHFRYDQKSVQSLQRRIIEQIVALKAKTTAFGFLTKQLSRLS